MLGKIIQVQVQIRTVSIFIVSWSIHFLFMNKWEPLVILNQDYILTVETMLVFHWSMLLKSNVYNCRFTRGICGKGKVHADTDNGVVSSVPMLDLNIFLLHNWGTVQYPHAHDWHHLLVVLAIAGHTIKSKEKAISYNLLCYCNGDNHIRAQEWCHTAVGSSGQ